MEDPLVNFIAKNSKTLIFATITMDTLLLLYSLYLM